MPIAPTANTASSPPAATAPTAPAGVPGSAVPTLDYASLGLPPDGRTRVEEELTIPRMSAAEAGALLDDPRTVFIDIRQAHEFRSGHIPGARRIQAQVDDGLLASQPRGQRLIVYCACHGPQAAARSAVILRALGHDDVHLLDGGLPAWQEAGLPVEAGDGR